MAILHATNNSSLLTGSLVTLSVTPTPTESRGNVFASGVATYTTISFTLSVSGGTSPYTYLWADTTAGIGELDPDSPTAATTTFTATIGPPGIRELTAGVTVTDSLGNEGTASVVVEVEKEEPDGGGTPY